MMWEYCCLNSMRLMAELILVVLGILLFAPLNTEVQALTGAFSAVLQLIFPYGYGLIILATLGAMGWEVLK